MTITSLLFRKESIFLGKIHKESSCLANGNFLKVKRRTPALLAPYLAILLQKFNKYCKAG